MKKTTLAKLAGLSGQQVYNLSSGRSEMTLRVADRFEVLTGIPSQKWTYPDKFGNAWDELAKLPEPKKEEI